MDYGWLVGLIVCGVFALIFLVAAALCFIGGDRWKFDPNDYKGLSRSWGFGALLIAAATFGLFTWVAYPPFDMSYHTYHNYTGKVTNVQGRFLSDGDKGTTQNFLIKMNSVTGEPMKGQFRLDDTRGAGLKVGDTLTIRCLKSWQYAAAAGYVCNYIHSSEDD